MASPPQVTNLVAFFRMREQEKAEKTKELESARKLQAALEKQLADFDEETNARLEAQVLYDNSAYLASATRDHQSELSARSASSKPDEVLVSQFQTTTSTDSSTNAADDALEILSEYKNIVTHEAKWIALSCGCCGGNYMKTQRSYLNGWMGLHIHYYLSHKPEGPWSMDRVKAHCEKTELSNEEIVNLKRGGEPREFKLRLVMRTRVHTSAAESRGNQG